MTRAPLGLAGLALLGIVPAPGAALLVAGLAGLAGIRVLLAPGLAAGPALLVAGLDGLASIRLLGTAFLDALLAILRRSGRGGKRHQGGGGE